MAVTFGFYDAVNGDRRHKAEEFSRLFEGIIRDGVFASIGTSLVVEVVGGMDIAIGVGRAWFENTWIDNDSPHVMKLDPAHISKNRIDAVVIEVDKNNRETIFKVVKGGEVEGVAGNPVLTDHQYPLAYVSVSLGVYEVIQANITNMVGTEACPFISGVLETITIEGVTVLLEDEFNRWFDGVKGQLDEDAAGNLQNQINELNIIIPKAFTSSYQAFIENINTDSLDAAFGKNNENNIRYLGRQLAMYAWFMGEDPILNPYTELQKLNILNDLNIEMIEEISSSLNIINIINYSPFAKSKLLDIIDDVVYFVTMNTGVYTIPENIKSFTIQAIGPGFGIKRGFFKNYFLKTNDYNSFAYEISMDKTSFGDFSITKEEAIDSNMSFITFSPELSAGNNGQAGGSVAPMTNGPAGGGGGGGAGYGAGGGGGAEGITGGAGGFGGLQILNHSVCGAGGGGGGSYSSSYPGGKGGDGGSWPPNCSGGVGGVGGVGWGGSKGGNSNGASGGAGRNSAGGSSYTGGNGGDGYFNGGVKPGGHGNPMFGAIIITLLTI